MTIGKKISLTLALCLTLTVVLGVVGVVNSRRITAMAGLLGMDALPGISSAGRLADHVLFMRGSMFLHLAASDPTKKHELESEVEERINEFRSEMRVYQSTITDPSDRELFDHVPPLFDSYCRFWYRVRDLSNSSREGDAQALYIADGRPLLLRLHKSITDASDLKRQRGEAQFRSVASSAETAAFWIVTLMALCVCSGSLSAWWTVRHVNRVLKRTADEVSGCASEVSASAGHARAPA